MWTTHEQWSILYLKKHTEEIDLDAGHGSRRFAECVNAIYSIFDDAQRDILRREVDEHSEIIGDIEENKESKADEYITKIFELGVENPFLAPLIGPTNNSRISLPDELQVETLVNTRIMRGDMYLNKGELDTAKEEFESVRKLRRQVARSLDSLGLTSRYKGKYAEKSKSEISYYEDSIRVEES